MSGDLRLRLEAVLSTFGGNRFLGALVMIAASVLLAKLVQILFRHGLGRWARRTDNPFDDRFVRLVERPIFASVVLAGLAVAAVQLELPAIYQLTVTRGLKSVAILVWLVFLLRMASLLVDVLDHLKTKVAYIQPSTLPLFHNTSRLVLAGGATYFLFLSWGIDVGALIASLGILGIAIGFAAKDTLSNVFSGIFILADAPYKVGDFIILDTGERGRVTQVGLRSTRLLTRDDIEVTLPNAVIANAKIINESGGPWEKERIRVPLSVAYGTDVDRVRELLLQIAGSHPELCGEPEPRVRFRAFGDSGLVFELLAWVDEPVLRGRILDALNTEIYKAFAREGIEIPYPKRDVYIHSAGPSDPPGEA